MFGSIGHAARDAKSLSQRSSGHINEVQPDEGVVSVVRKRKGFTLGWDVPPSQSQFCEGSSALRQGKDQPNSCGLHLNVKANAMHCNHNNHNNTLCIYLCPCCIQDGCSMAFGEDESVIGRVFWLRHRVAHHFIEEHGHHLGKGSKTPVTENVRITESSLEFFFSKNGVLV